MDPAPFHVPRARAAVSRAVLAMRELWRRLGNLESAYLRDRLEDITIRRPVWVSGLARSGSTVLLEVLASAPGVATHQYRDFPFLHTPYWWRGFLRRSTRGTPEPVERAHGDRVQVTPASPEAMEEVLWNTFFPALHDPRRSNVLDGGSRNPAFETFYRDHIRKLLLVTDGTRYVAKANYNLTRLPYLLALFPDARFVVPVRHPVGHVASLVKQHALFTGAAREHPRAVEHLDHVGHYEFGPHRTPVNAGDDGAVAAVTSDWAEGRDVRGWARYWAHLYGWLRERLEQDDALRAATLVVRYEDLCSDPSATLRRVLRHTGLDEHAETVIPAFADAISLPTYYSPAFTAGEREAITAATADVARWYGFGPEGHAPAENGVDES